MTEQDRSTLYIIVIAMVLSVTVGLFAWFPEFRFWCADKVWSGIEYVIDGEEAKRKPARAYRIGGGV